MFYKFLKRKFLFFTIFLVISSCNIPKDPENSWKESQRDGLRVGVLNNPPFVILKDSKYTGSEINLIQNFAEEHNLQVTYKSGNETELVEKLENYELDVLIGGFTENTIWTEKVGKSTSYDADAHVFLIPKGENRLLYFIESFIFNHKKK